MLSTRRRTFLELVARTVSVVGVTVIWAVVREADGFSFVHRGGAVNMHQSLVVLEASTLDESVVYRVKPVKSTTSQRTKREKVQHEDFSGSSESQRRYMAEILSAAETMQRPPSTKRKGRPDYVPGAMTFERMLRFQERQAILEMTSKNKLHDLSAAEAAVIAPYVRSSSGPGGDFLRPGNSTSDMLLVKGESISKNGLGSATLAGMPAVVSQTQIPLSTSKIVNDLAAADDISEEDRRRKFRKRLGNDNALHYDAELLTRDEEYSLGMKVNFMVKCEKVHEGLATNMMRHPTIEEWARACGFKEADPMFVAMEADNQLRPAGWESMFDKVDPDMFVGNGRAGDAGVGRGHGRVQEPPPLKLEDFYDDSVLRAKMRECEEGGVSTVTGGETFSYKVEEQLEPINRGTPTNFVEMMMAGKEAKQRMVQSNMRLVVSIARKYYNTGVGLPDLIQEGSLGLSRAAEKFDPQRGFKFSTYASWWIQQTIFRSIAYHSRTIRLPMHVHNLMGRVRKVRAALLRDLGRNPTDDEIAEKLWMSTQKYRKMISLTKRSVSLETPKFLSNAKDAGNENVDSIGDSIASTSADDNTPERRVDHGLFHEDLQTMLDMLEDDERYVITLRYGLDDGITRTVTSVASVMKQSPAYVRSQENRALRKLRRPWYEKKLREHQGALNT